MQVRREALRKIKETPGSGQCSKVKRESKGEKWSSTSIQRTPMGGCFVPQETLMYWKETRSRKEKRQKEKAKGMAEKKKKHETGTR